MMQLGKRLKTTRLELGLNQCDLAERTGVTQATISRIESGKVTNVRPITVHRLAQGLAMTVEYLLGQSDEMTLDEQMRLDGDFRTLVESYVSLSAEKKRSLASFAEYLKEVKTCTSTSHGIQNLNHSRS